MKRLIAVATLCTLFSVSAFAVLVSADRRLGVPLPYSIPWAFAVVSAVAPIVFAIANAVRMRRPVIVKVTPVTPRSAEGLPDPAVPRRAEGVVLLDFSSAKKLRERAA